MTLVSYRKSYRLFLFQIPQGALLDDDFACFKNSINMIRAFT